MFYKTDTHRGNLCQYTSQPGKDHLHVYERYERERVCVGWGAFTLCSSENVFVSACFLIEHVISSVLYAKGKRWHHLAFVTVSSVFLCSLVIAARTVAKGEIKSTEKGEGKTSMPAVPIWSPSRMPLKWRTWPLKKLILKSKLLWLLMEGRYIYRRKASLLFFT